MAERKIQWHPGFCAAMRLEMKQEADCLDYVNEYNLNMKPLEIDLLIVKKEKQHTVGNEIGRIFRKYNILEYKSPDDELNMDTFYKGNGYACLFKAYGAVAGPGIDSIEARQITISFIRARKPVKLMKKLAEEGWTIQNPCRGIYHISGRGFFPVQIVVTKELSDKEHIWLKAISGGITLRTAEELVIQSQNLSSRKEKLLADSVLDISVRANKGIYGKLKKEGTEMCEALQELMADELAESREEGIREGRRKGKEEGIREGRRKGKEEGLKEGKKEGMKEGLKAIVFSLKALLPDFDAVYQVIIQNEPYRNISREQVMEFYR